MANRAGDPDKGKPRKLLVLPPSLDMGLLKTEDLVFDLEEEVARLRALTSVRHWEPLAIVKR